MKMVVDHFLMPSFDLLNFMSSVISMADNLFLVGRMIMLLLFYNDSFNQLIKIWNAQSTCFSMVDDVCPCNVIGHRYRWSVGSLIVLPMIKWALFLLMFAHSLCMFSTFAWPVTACFGRRRDMRVIPWLKEFLTKLKKIKSISNGRSLTQDAPDNFY